MGRKGQQQGNDGENSPHALEGSMATLESTADRTEDFWVKLVNITADGMKLEAGFQVDLTKFPTGPARGHDMLLY